MCLVLARPGPAPGPALSESGGWEYMVGPGPLRRTQSPYRRPASRSHYHDDDGAAGPAGPGTILRPGPDWLSATRPTSPLVTTGRFAWNVTFTR